MVEGSGLENRRAREGPKGSNPFSSVRACGACDAALEAEVHDEGPRGRVLVFRCACGWAAARVEPSAGAQHLLAQRAMARALERMSGPEVAPAPDGVYGPGDNGGKQSHE